MSVAATTEKDVTIQPFLKWPGGKRRLVSEILPLVPQKYGRYIEPFLGGAALFFRLQPWPATLSDTNPELINVYRQVRDNVDEIIKNLSKLEISQEIYSQIRSRQEKTPLMRAVKFLYLNRTAFNGIYRVNQKGEFNVPFGCKAGTVVCDEDLLRNASSALQKRRLVVCDFETVIDEAASGDLVYADPPYTTKHNNNGFRRYNEVIFSWNDQERLAKCLYRASKRGVYIILSNADHAPLTSLYTAFSIKRVLRQSLISGKVSGRGKISECLIYKNKEYRG